MYRSYFSSFATDSFLLSSSDRYLIIVSKISNTGLQTKLQSLLHPLFNGKGQSTNNVFVRLMYQLYKCYQIHKCEQKVTVTVNVDDNGLLVIL